jgi:hypothetical protein
MTEAFGADLEEVREPPDEARARGKVTDERGPERLTFPSTVFVSEDGTRHGVYGWSAYEEYRQAADAAGANRIGVEATDALAVIERFGRTATREVEALLDRPRPLVEAELWALARDWKVRAVPVLTGTLWEKAA